MAYRTTEADLRIFLRDKTVKVPDGEIATAGARRATLLSETGIPKSLRKARHDYADGEWREFAITPLEEALFWMGEVVALSYGYRITADIQGHRWRSLECLKEYIDVFVPAYAPLTRAFHDIGTARNNRSYRETPPSAEEVGRWLDAADKVWSVFRVDVARRAQRQ